MVVVFGICCNPDLLVKTEDTIYYCQEACLRPNIEFFNLHTICSLPLFQNLKLRHIYLFKELSIQNVVSHPSGAGLRVSNKYHTKPEWMLSGDWRKGFIKQFLHAGETFSNKSSFEAFNIAS